MLGMIAREMIQNLNFEYTVDNIFTYVTFFVKDLSTKSCSNTSKTLQSNNSNNGETKLYQNRLSYASWLNQ